MERMVNGREDKTMGVEIELFLHDAQRFVTVAARHGVNVHMESYNHRTPRGYWKLTTDGSLVAGASHKTLNMSGLELVSPPLKRADMEAQLKAICNALKEVDARVNTSCGVHVHHDINDLNVNQIQNLYRLYAKHEYSLDTFFPASRRDTQWAQHVSPYMLARAERATSIAELKSLLADNNPRDVNRYHALNFCSYISYGTIEFRQHGASLDFEKIMNWAIISQSIVAAACKKKKVNPLTAHMSTRHNLAFTRDIYIEGTVEGKFFEKRRAEIARMEAGRAGQAV